MLTTLTPKERYFIGLMLYISAMAFSGGHFALAVIQFLSYDFSFSAVVWILYNIVFSGWWGYRAFDLDKRLSYFYDTYVSK